MAPPIDLEAHRVTNPVLEVEEYDSYSWMLLEDHPLRSYPADCPPGFFSWAHGCYTMGKKSWRERFGLIFCLLLMAFVVIQFLLQLPKIASYVLQPVLNDEFPAFIQWSAGENHGESTCFSVNTQTVDIVDIALANSCTSIKVDLWLHERELLVGSSRSALAQNNTLQNVYINPLREKLNARNSIAHRVADENDTPVGLFDDDPWRSFTLYLEIQTRGRATWPYLVSQLEVMWKDDYLSYRSKPWREEKGDLVMRPVTVMVVNRKQTRRRFSWIENLKRVA